MWLWARRPSWRPQPCEVNQTWLFGPLFHQEILYMAKCGGNHFLTSGSYLGQWRSYSWCMWPKVHIRDVDICSTHVSQVEEVYMDPIRVWVHYEENLWQAQKNLISTSKCGWTDSLGWLLTIPRYCLLRPKAQEGHLALAHKPDTFHSIMGLCSFWWSFYISRMWVRWMGFMSLSL
jgi:hypothetical protein